MQPEKAAPRAGPLASRLPSLGVRPGDRLRAAWRRATGLLHTLVVALSGGDGARGGSDGRALVDAGDALEVSLSLPLDGRGPRAARNVVDGLRGRIAPSVLADAQIVVSELVGNAVRHSGVSDGGVVVLCVKLTDTAVRLEVTDPGCGGVIAPRAPDRERGGGFGLQIVRALSAEWGLEQSAGGGTRVWAELPRTPTAAPTAEQGGHAAGQVSANGQTSNGRARAERERPPGRRSAARGRGAQR